MRDTPPAMDDVYTEMFMAHSGPQRLLMGDSMYATARALVTAAVLARNPTASPAEIRQAVFTRFYGHEVDEGRRARILAHLALTAAPGVDPSL